MPSGDKCYKLMTEPPSSIETTAYLQRQREAQYHRTKLLPLLPTSQAALHELHQLELTGNKLGHEKGRSTSRPHHSHLHKTRAPIPISIQSVPAHTRVGYRDPSTLHRRNLTPHQGHAAATSTPWTPQRQQTIHPHKLPPRQYYQKLPHSSDVFGLMCPNSYADNRPQVGTLQSPEPRTQVSSGANRWESKGSRDVFPKQALYPKPAKSEDLVTWWFECKSSVDKVGLRCGVGF